MHTNSIAAPLVVPLGVNLLLMPGEHRISCPPTRNNRYTRNVLRRTFRRRWVNGAEIAATIIDAVWSAGISLTSPTGEPSTSAGISESFPMSFAVTVVAEPEWPWPSIDRSIIQVL